MSDPLDPRYPDTWPAATCEDLARGYQILRPRLSAPLRSPKDLASVEGASTEISLHVAERHCTRLQRVRDGFYRLKRTHPRTKPSSSLPETIPEICDAFETMLEDSAKRFSTYVVLDADCPVQRAHLCLPLHPLGCGKKLQLTRTKHKGVHTSYAYVSCGQTCTALHQEDAALRSANILYYGAPKVWMFVAPADRERLEHLVRQQIGTQLRCDQGMRHENLIVAPSRLRSHGINPSIVVQRPGTMIVTLERAYHQVINLGPNVAEAINLAGPGWPDPAYKYCGKQCRSANWPTISARSLEMLTPHNMVEEGHMMPLGGPAEMKDSSRLSQHRKQARDATITCERTALLCTSRMITPSYDIPSELDQMIVGTTNPAALGNSNSRIMRLIRSICSQEALTQLHDLVVLVTGKQDQRSTYALMWLRGKMELLQLVAAQARSAKHSPDSVMWKRIVEPLPGLVCFMPLKGEVCGVTGQDYAAVADTELSQFHKVILRDPLLGTLAAFGDRVLLLLMGGMEAIPDQFRRTVAEINAILALPLSDLAWNSGQYSTNYRVEFNSTDFSNAKRPDRWPLLREWPSDPIRVREAPFCDLCNDTQCLCLSSLVHNIRNPGPIIKTFGNRGRGLQALARPAETVAYRKGDLIGFMGGRALPLESHCASGMWYFQLPGLCFIDCRSNIFSLLNHSCRASAAIHVRQLSGQSVLCVEAARDLNDGDEINIAHTDDSVIQQCPCVWCRDHN